MADELLLAMAGLGLYCVEIAFVEIEIFIGHRCK